jgi:hypothetical protein
MKAMGTTPLEVARREGNLQQAPRLLVRRGVVGNRTNKYCGWMFANDALDVVGNKLVIVPLLACQY